MIDGEDDDDEDEPSIPKNELPNFGGDEIPCKPIVYSNESIKGYFYIIGLDSPNTHDPSRIMKSENKTENIMSFGDNSFKERIKD
jgi:hypothetical protein